MYEIIVEGHLDTHWSAWFEGLILSPMTDEKTLISGEMVDQTALFGVLKKIHHLGLRLVSVRRVEVIREDQGSNHEQ